MSENKVLTHLDLSNKSSNNSLKGGNHLYDEGGKAVAQLMQTNKKITHLNVRESQIGVIGEKALANSLHTNRSLIQFEPGKKNL